MNKRDLKDGMIVRTRGIKDEYYEFYILSDSISPVTLTLSTLDNSLL